LDDLPLLKKSGLFSGATNSHTHTDLFYGWPVQVEKRKSGLIVMGDLPKWRNGLIVMGDLSR
jgi:hypothetical protein